MVIRYPPVFLIKCKSNYRHVELISVFPALPVHTCMWNNYCKRLFSKYFHKNLYLFNDNLNLDSLSIR